MTVLETAIEPRSSWYFDARDGMLAALAELATALDAAREGGGERAVTRHHARGKLLARERLELLVDRDSPLLELSPVAGWGTGGPVGAAVVTAIGVVEDRLCVLAATDPTVRGGTVGDATIRKLQRAQQIAWENRLPMISLLETSGVEPAEPSPVWLRIGDLLAGYAQLAAGGVPTLGVLFGDSCDLDGGDLAHSFDHLVTLNPDATGRAPDYVAEDERDALRLTRHSLRRFPALARARPRGPEPAPPPRHDPEDLLAVPATEPREILNRVLDGSQLHEIRPGYGPAVCAGWGALHGYQVAVVAVAGGRTGDEEVTKAVRLIELAGHAGTPVLFLGPGTVATTRTEAAIVTAVARAGVPVLALRVGGWDGPAAVTAQARLRFAWPIASPRPAASREGSPASGRPSLAGGHRSGSPSTERPVPTRAAADPAGSALAASGQLADDGVIDPRDTRTVLGLCLCAVQRGQP